MHDAPPALAHYLIGIPDCPGAPPTIGVPQVYDTAVEAESALGVVMMLCRMTHGDTVVDSSSWYLQSAAVADVLPNSGDVCFGYLLDDDVIYPVAGGWEHEGDAECWAPFVYEVEQRHAFAARMPWVRSMLKQFRLSDLAGVEQIDVDYFRFAARSSRLLVRPLDLYVTEPLF